MKRTTHNAAVREPLAIDSVVSAATRLSSVFAKLLRGAQPGRPLAWTSRERDGIRQVAEQLCSSTLPLILDRTALRWQSLIDVASSRLPATTRRRPDVLTLTRDALALPEHPHTRTLVDFAICANLRELYGIGHSLSDLELLRQSFQDLEESFEGRQRRRIKKEGGAHTHFLVDIVNMSGHVWRAPDAESFDAYCAGFSSSPFGVTAGQRDFGTGIWPELFGELPPFASVLRRAYGVPLGVAGLDEALGALQVPFPGPTGAPGAITLVSGPSGSGRTTLLSEIASALSELGLFTHFLSATESNAALESRLRGLHALTPASLWSHWLPSVRPRRGPLELVSLDSVATFRTAMRPLMGPPRRTPSKKRADTTEPGMPHAIFLDGVTAVLERRSKSEFGAALIRLRDSGAYLFVSCTDAEREGFDLDRLADNVLQLGFHSDSGHHTARVLSVDKTRFQSSQRDRHVLNIGETGGCWLSPSLHTVNRSLSSLRATEPSPAHTFQLPHREAVAPRRRAGVPSLREGSHVLLQGPGSSGKAGLALACALAPSGGGAPDSPPKPKRRKGHQALQSLPRRTLVVSFLFNEPYYRKFSSRLLHGDASPPDTLAVWTLYPGYIDAETFISKLQKRLTTAELLGRPFGSVVFDGIHNMLLEFPVLRSDALLWPTVVRLLRSNGIRAVSTLTSFDDRDAAFERERSAGVASLHEALVPTLMSSSDYVLEMRRAETPNGRARTHVRVVSSSSEGLRVGDRYLWENDALTLVRGRA